MANNTSPIFQRNGTLGFAPAVLTANTAMDGTGTVATLFTAHATEGSYVRCVRFKALGTNVATVARIFINNGGATTTATNNFLYDEIALAATTASNSTTTTTYELPFNFVLPAGYRITLTLGTTVANGWQAHVIGGDM